MSPPPPSLLLRGGIVFNVDDGVPSIAHSDIRIVGSLIESIGPHGSIDSMPGDEVLEFQGKCILPGLVDLHFHTALGKGMYDDLPLDRWIIAWWYPVLRAMDPEIAYWAGMLAYADAVRSGTTCVNDMSRHLPSLASAASAVGIRVVLANTIAEPAQDLDHLADTSAALASIDRSPLVDLRVGIEWMPYVSRDLLDGARELAMRHGIGLHLHLNESREEVALTEARHGLRPTELAAEHGLLGPSTVAAHGVWLDDGEIARIAETGTYLSHNASSNAKLGNGIARLGAMQAAGITVGLGHDGAESNNSRDLFEVMKFTSLIHRASRIDPTILRAPEILTMATANGADALGTGGGSVAAGRTADLTVVDLESLTFTPFAPDDPEQLAAHLVFSADRADVDTVIIGGRVVCRDHRLTLVDEVEIRENANRCFARVLKAVTS